MKTTIKKVTSVLLMWLFTVFAFVILAVSTVVLAIESMVSAVLPPAKAVKKARKI